MNSTATTSPAIARFIATHSTGNVEHRSQSVKFDFANGRTGHIMINEAGGFAGAMAYRGDICLGHYSTLKSFVRVAS